MLAILPLIALGVISSASAAAILRSDQTCTFSLTSSGIQANYILNNAGLHDSMGNICSIIPATSQFVCSGNTAGHPSNFTVNSEGLLLHDGDSNWATCSNSEGTLYSDKKVDATGTCQNVQLTADDLSCAPVPLFSGTGASTSDDTPTCPSQSVRQGNDFQYPHLIVPVSAEDPDHAFGTQFNAWISDVNTTLFNFDIPYDGAYADKMCSLVFLFPYASELPPQPISALYDFSGTEQEVVSNGGLNFAFLDGIADQGTTFNNKPAVLGESGPIQVIPGNEYIIDSWPCEGGTYTFSISSVNRVTLNYFQNYGYKPIGLYIVPC